MCGITGVGLPPGEVVDEGQLAQAVDKLAHRGPDGQAVWFNPARNVGLGHTRLAIIDLVGGQQPLCNEDGQVVVTFNGEIYNHADLRRKLTCLGHTFRTHSDTEVLVHLYEQYGPDMVSQLNGMFAFAIWDQRRGELFLARDRLGQKPLFFAPLWSSLEKGIAFASELDALLPLLTHRPSVDRQSLSHYLTFQYVPGDLCIFEGVHKLQPGEWLLWSAEKVRRQRYWTPPVPQAIFSGTFDDAATHLRQLLLDATRLRLVSDVPVGVLLSGGLDSSAVVGLMAEAGAERIRTFTASFAGSGADERPFAREVSQRFGTEHTELDIAAPDWPMMQSIHDLYGEPFADTSAVATYLISKTARQHVKVALTGDGGDESLLGYSRYAQFDRYLRHRRWLRPALHLSGLHLLATTLCPSPGPRNWRRRLRTFATLWDPLPGDVYMRWLGAFHGPWKQRLLGPMLNEVGTDDIDASQYRVCHGLEKRFTGDWITAAAAFDLESYLPDAVLTKVDRASMAVGLECRSPFLDYRVVEFLATLPRQWKLHPRHGSKWILKRACCDLLPDSILHRGKEGFGSPVGQWFRTAWKGHLESSCLPVGPMTGWINESFVREMIREHQTGEVDHTYRLWTLASLRRFVERQEHCYDS